MGKESSRDEEKDIVKTIYNPIIYDASKIEVKAAQKKQFSCKFNEKNLDYTIQTNQVSKEYDYYLISTYKDKKRYTMKVFDQKLVSKNKIVTLEKISPYDTFFALLFIQANRTIEVIKVFFAMRS